MKSYSSESRGFLLKLREAKSLLRLHNVDAPGRVRTEIEDAKHVEATVRKFFAVELKNLDMLEIGPGQLMLQMFYFSMNNRVIGIDSDVLVRGFRPFAYISMALKNGGLRTIKTLGRKLMGFDRKYGHELLRQLNLKRLPPLTLHEMDVCKMSFRNESFDFVYSRGVFHHLNNPIEAIEEVARILRPGGVVYITIHPYTSLTGCLSPDVFSQNFEQSQGWPHLRPALQGRIAGPNVFLNKLRLDDWRRLVSSRMPSAQYIVRPGDDYAVAAAQKLQAQGELLDYSLEELCAGEFDIVWRKPAAQI